MTAGRSAKALLEQTEAVGGVAVVAVVAAVASVTSLCKAPVRKRSRILLRQAFRPSTRTTTLTILTAQPNSLPQMQPVLLPMPIPLLRRRTADVATVMIAADGTTVTAVIAEIAADMGAIGTSAPRVFLVALLPRLRFMA
jgi:hypothetical protein